MSAKISWIATMNFIIPSCLNRAKRRFVAFLAFSFTVCVWRRCDASPAQIRSGLRFPSWPDVAPAPGWLLPSSHLGQQPQSFADEKANSPISLLQPTLVFPPARLSRPPTYLTFHHPAAPIFYPLLCGLVRPSAKSPTVKHRSLRRLLGHCSTRVLPGVGVNRPPLL